MLREKGRFLEPKSPSRQKAGLRAGIEEEAAGVTLVFTRHRAPAIPIAPLQAPAIPIAALQVPAIGERITP